MKYHAPTKQFTVAAKDLEFAALCFLYAIRQIREASNLPLTKYKHETALTSADFAQKSIIDGAKALGVDLGCDWGNEIDVSEAS